jgi:hypothetical protein
MRREADRYLVRDPTFGDEVWLSRRAVDDETSGNFLIRSGALGPGWRTLSEAEGQAIWGSGYSAVQNPQYQGPVPCECPSCPMASYGLQQMLVALYVEDTPVSYTPPRGPAVQFTVSYNEREVFQPQNFYYSNLGAKWTFGWISYVEDDPETVGQTVNVYLRGGGQETYTGYNPVTQSYAPSFRTQALLTRVADGGSPLGYHYEKRLSNGSVEVFAQPDGSLAFPRRCSSPSSGTRRGNP